MSKTIVRSSSKILLEGFVLALKLFNEDAVVTQIKDAIIVEDTDDLPDAMYEISREFGVEVLHQGSKS